MVSKMEGVLQEAYDIIHNDRRKEYGPVDKSFNAIAAGWEQILNVKITAQEVALCMIWLKVCRETHKHNRDNIRDVCGYAALIEELQ